MRLTALFIGFLVVASSGWTSEITVPAIAVQTAQEWLDTQRAKDPALEGARLGNGYATLSWSPRGTVEFMRTTTITDPTLIADSRSREFDFPILKGDSCFSSIRVTSWGAPGELMPLPHLEHSPQPTDRMVMALDRLVAKGSHRVWVFRSPWPSSCKTIIAEKPAGNRVAFETERFLHEVPDDASMMKMSEPVFEWADRLRARLRSIYGLDLPRQPVSHAVPTAATIAAERVISHRSFEEQMRVFNVSGTPTLGSPSVEYSLSPVEQLLYSESDDSDPTTFDADPFYKFPVIVGGKQVTVMSIKRSLPGCDVSTAADAIEAYRAVSFQQMQPGSNFDWWPKDLARFGDVAVLNVDHDHRWYHIVGTDSMWVAPYYPPRLSSSSYRQSVVSMAVTLKKQIAARYAE